MIGSTRTLRVWAYPAAADLRKGFDGLCGLVTQRRQDPLAGDCFLFVNRVRTRAKVLLVGRDRAVRVPQAARAGAVCGAVGAGRDGHRRADAHAERAEPVSRGLHVAHAHGALAGRGDAADVDAAGRNLALTAS